MQKIDCLCNTTTPYRVIRLSLWEEGERNSILSVPIVPSLATRYPRNANKDVR